MRITDVETKFISWVEYFEESGLTPADYEAEKMSGFATYIYQCKVDGHGVRILVRNFEDNGGWTELEFELEDEYISDGIIATSEMFEKMSLLKSNEIVAEYLARTALSTAISIQYYKNISEAKK